MTAPIFMTNDQIVKYASAAGATEPVDKVSNRYTFVPTLKAVDLLRDAGWFPIKAEQSGTRIQDKEGFQKHCIRFTRNENFEMKPKDERIDLVLYNSHDLGSSFKLIASVWRLVCGNGLMVASDFANFTHRHVGFNENDFAESADKITASATLINDQMDYLKGIPLGYDEQIVYAESAHKLVYEDLESAPIVPEQLLTQRRFDDGNNSLWITFQRVQENIIKGGVKGKVYGENGPRKVTTRAVQSLDRNIKLNQALWVLTERMAELKSMAVAA
ncbi:MAG: DUF945 domain-containing protein [Proteobacteria bacterium]|jgi:hypothetical protein|nr:DUF945 domain-containing protein [Desulfocapsa sp.]MBU3944334.1 DUF945 domain-containing protein [Pseudomonadota bacterium]MCG2745849.1 DUF945 domain-containing protein [Desulfobacteraceae bacterium]MBU4029814.1 DUF945 domain-containing protein [Pseudomonadota bacterium]MBU4042276.1 DUF945 domain-containing protein [Pseudomonadota bacterium]